MTDVRFSVSKMFAHLEPWDVSNSVANLGPLAAELTWGCAMEVAGQHEDTSRPGTPDWLICPLTDAVDYICDWAKDTGAWTAAEIEAWTIQECLALLVQNVASDMRMLGSDDNELEACVREASSFSEQQENLEGHYWCERGGEVMGEVCS